MAAHSNLGPSSMYRWAVCPVSPRLSKGMPDVSFGIHAARGTAAHMVLENCFQTDVDIWEYEDYEFDKEHPDGALVEEDIESVETAIEWLEEKIEELELEYGEVIVLKEVRVDLFHINRELFGTSDIIIYTEDLKYIGVFDYKNGTSKVKVDGNYQIMYYLLAAIANIAKVADLVNAFGVMEMGVLQPRAKYLDCVPVSAEELLTFQKELSQAVARTEDENAMATPGSHCFFCRAKPSCPAVRDKRNQDARDDFGVKGDF